MTALCSYFGLRISPFGLLSLACLLFGTAFAQPAPASAPAAPTAPPAPPKLFALTFTTGSGWDAAKPYQEQKFIKEHGANLARLYAAGRVVLGGRHGDKGSLVVRAEDEADIRAELAKDPSLAAGTFNVLVEEYRPFFQGQTRPPAATPEVLVVRAALAAFNAHDVDALTALYADDLKWLGVDSDKLSIEGEGREAMRTWLTGYFKNTQDVRSEISDISQTGTLVAFRERATWTAKDGSKRAQSSHAIYEVRDGKIKRAWYFPAAREPSVPAAAAPTPSASK